MKINRNWLIPVVAVLTVSLSVCFRLLGPRTKGSSKLGAAAGEEQIFQSGAKVEAGLRLNLAAISLQTAGDGQAVRSTLAELRDRIARLPRQAASAGIVEFLDSKSDARTGFGFVIGPDGFLKDAPSLRTFLLDYLAQVDPRVAGTYAERILSSPNSPDEWAVALRNYAAANSTPEAAIFLRTKVAELLGVARWRENPSVGYLEAFDVAVHVGGNEVTSLLGELVRLKDNPAVAHAAYLALDRLVLREGATVLAQLSSQPELMDGREATRANFFARAQVSDPKQRVVLESYLLNPGISQVELATFAGIYPNANFMISHNLLTRADTPDGAALARRDREALNAVESWLSDPRFAKVQPHLENIRKRLQSFLTPPR